MQSSAISRLAVLRGQLQNNTLSDEQLARNSCKASEPTTSRFASAAEAVALIPNEAIVTTGGFVGSGSPEHLYNALRERFDSTAEPRGLHLVTVATTGDRKGRGQDVLGVEGLISKFSFGWTGNCPSFIKLMKDNKIEGWNLPLGAVSHIVRAAAGGLNWHFSKIGLQTFVDPRNAGGKVNSRTKSDAVQLTTLNGEKHLMYTVPRINVALLRGTTADELGNISFEHEVFVADALNQAIAAYRNGGLVIVQVQRIVQGGSIPARLVHIPGALISKVVVAPASEHWQSFMGPEIDHSVTGSIKRPLHSLKRLPLDVRKVIAHRCMLAIETPRALVNLGVGMPEAVAVIVNTHAAKEKPEILPVTLSTEVGLVGGMPAGGMLFGASYNAESVMPCSTMIDLIHSGRLDLTVLGCAEVDRYGNVNVSQFSGRQPGCGGFIDISQSAKQVIFAGTFTSSGLEVKIADGKIAIKQEGRIRKFKEAVQEITFAGQSKGNRQILYITERCVFQLIKIEGEPKLELMEIAPGIRLKEDLLDLMGFTPLIRNLKQMDCRCFEP